MQIMNMLGATGTSFRSCRVHQSGRQLEHTSSAVRIGQLALQRRLGCGLLRAYWDGNVQGTARKLPPGRTLLQFMSMGSWRARKTDLQPEVVRLRYTERSESRRELSLSARVLISERPYRQWLSCQTSSGSLHESAALADAQAPTLLTRTGMINPEDSP